MHRLPLSALAVSALLSSASLLGVTPASAAPVVVPTVLLPNITIAEGNAGKAVFQVNVGLSRPNPFDHAVTMEAVDYSPIALPGGGGTYGTATPGQDYVAFGHRILTFQPGQQVATLAIAVKGDHVPEGNEEIDVRFDDTEFIVGDNDIDLVLADDDTSPTASSLPVLLLPNQDMPEPDRGCFPFKVSVWLDKPAIDGATVDAVDFSAVPLPDGSGTYGTATPGSDYLGFGTKTLHFAAGGRVAVLPIRICGDTTVEPNEQIDARFDNTTTVAIFDNDIDLGLVNTD